MLSQLEGSLNFGGNKSMETVVIKCHSKPPARATLMLTWKKEIFIKYSSHAFYRAWVWTS